MALVPESSVAGQAAVFLWGDSGDPSACPLCQGWHSEMGCSVPTGTSCPSHSPAALGVKVKGRICLQHLRDEGTGRKWVPEVDSSAWAKGLVPVLQAAGARECICEGKTNGKQRKMTAGAAANQPVKWLESHPTVLRQREGGRWHLSPPQ